LALVNSENLVPSEVVEHLLGIAPQELEENQPLGPLVLLVRSPAEDDGGFLKEVAESILAGSPTKPETAAWLSTSEFPALSAARLEPAAEVDLVELIAELGSETHAVVPLLFADPSKDLVIGRSSEADIRLNHPGISARHAVLIRQGPSVKLKDLGSKNGTRVNDRPLAPEEERWLQPMDRVSFGRVQGFLCEPRALRAGLLQGLRPAPAL
jgi:hypothetical protein